MDELLDRLQEALAGRYAIERELGAGGMATVYLAHDTRHNRKVAIKVMQPDLAALIGAERFLQEIETTANLQHPNILPLFDSGRVDGTVFYVMPYVQGESLRSRLLREKQLPVAEALRIATELAQGLDYAHRHGVIHRDIKPDNVLFHDGRALIADFGIALALSQEDGKVRITKTGVSLGTPAYMSPEQAAGEQTLDPRADVYALGVVLYEMLAGEPPFTGLTAQAIFARVMSEEARPLRLKRRSVPQHIDDAVTRALEKLPADRWQTVGQFAEALTRPSAPQWAPGYRTRSATPWAVSAALLLALAWVGLGSRRAASPSSGPIRFNVEMDMGVEPTFTPIVRLSADGSQLFVTGMVGRRRGSASSPEPTGNGSHRGSRPGRAGNAEQPAVRVARRAMGRVREAGQALEGAGGRWAARRARPRRLGGRQLGKKRQTRIHLGIQHRPVDRQRGWW